MLAEAEDPIGVSVGDEVVIEGRETGQPGSGLAMGGGNAAWHPW